MCLNDFNDRRCDGTLTLNTAQGELQRQKDLIDVNVNVEIFGGDWCSNKSRTLFSFDNQHTRGTCHKGGMSTSTPPAGEKR